MNEDTYMKIIVALVVIDMFIFAISFENGMEDLFFASMMFMPISILLSFIAVFIFKDND